MDDPPGCKTICAQGRSDQPQVSQIVCEWLCLLSSRPQEVIVAPFSCSHVITHAVIICSGLALDTDRVVSRANHSQVIATVPKYMRIAGAAVGQLAAVAAVGQLAAVCRCLQKPCRKL